MTWLNTHLHFEQPALAATLLDYVHEVHHAGERIARLEKAIDQAIVTAPERIRSVIAAVFTIVRFRSADIRVINRRIRSSLPPVLLLIHMLLRAFLDRVYFAFT